MVTECYTAYNFRKRKAQEEEEEVQKKKQQAEWNKNFEVWSYSLFCLLFGSQLSIHLFSFLTLFTGIQNRSCEQLARLVEGRQKIKRLIPSSQDKDGKA